MYIPVPALLVYLGVVNLAAYLLMAVDKHRAKKKKSRISEANLMWVAAVGGAPLALVAMYTLRHKTRHPKFTWGVPALLILQLAIAAWQVWMKLK